MKDLLSFLFKILKIIEDNGRILTIIAMTLIVFIQVAARIIFKWSSPAMEESARFIMIWSIFIGAVVTTREDSHICMGGFVSSPKGKAVFNIISKVVTLLFLCVFVKWSYEYALHSYSKNMSSIVLDVPLIVVHSCFMVTGSLMVIHTFLHLLKQIKNVRQLYRGDAI
ncbi:MAG: TRAP transporter small permease [Desulfobacula sp.]|nr:TRAP transporter small permease [Desulfobacula sp.]